MTVRRIATASLLAALVLTLASCRKKEEEPSRGGSESASAPASSTSDWSVVGDVAVRIDKVRVQKPTVEERAFGKKEPLERDLDAQELMVWFTIENRTKTKKIEYHGWDIAGIGSRAPEAADEHGNKYQHVSHSSLMTSLKGRGKTGAINPGDPPISDVMCFQRPVDAATKLTLTLPSLLAGEKGRHVFEIPAAALTGGGKAVVTNPKEPAAASAAPLIPAPKAEEKFAGMNEWAQVGDVRVRIVKAKIQKVPLISQVTGKTSPSSEPELMLWFEIENRSEVKLVTYLRWESKRLIGQEGITDEHDNKYRIQKHDLIEGAPLMGLEKLRPGSAAVTDIVCVEPPVDRATRIRLVLYPVELKRDGVYRFEIHSSAWQ